MRSAYTVLASVALVIAYFEADDASALRVLAAGIVCALLAIAHSPSGERRP